MDTNEAIFIYEDYLDRIDPRNDYLKEDISYHIAKHFSKLSQVVNPNTLISHMLIPDIVYAQHEIRVAIPDFDINDHLDVCDYSSAKAFLVDLLKLGADINLIVKKWPRLLNFEDKLQHGVNPDLIFETESELSRDQAIKLLELGANPDKIANEVYLTVEQMIRYGVNPSRIMKMVRVDSEQALIRVHLPELLENGLDPEELVRMELQTVNTRSLYEKRFDMLWWYDEKLELLTKYAKDKESFWDAYFELVEEIIFGAGIMDQDTEDVILLGIMKKPVKLGLISLDEAVKYLHGINEEYDEDELGNPVPNQSILLNEQYVRTTLSE